MKKIVFCSLFISMLCGSVLAEENSTFLVSNGPIMYGYDVIHTEYLSVDGASAPTDGYSFRNKLDMIQDHCVNKLNGLALLNVRQVFALGEISEYINKEKKSGVSTISPAIRYSVSADCVVKAKKKSSSFFD